MTARRWDRALIYGSAVLLDDRGEIGHRNACARLGGHGCGRRQSARGNRTVQGRVAFRQVTAQPRSGQQRITERMSGDVAVGMACAAVSVDK